MKFVLVYLAAAPAFAQVELRAQYGALQKKPDGFNTSLNEHVHNGPALGAPTVMGADLLISPPLFPVVFGLRYETLSAKANGTGTLSSTNVTVNRTLSGSRTLALAGYRILSLPIGYLGLLAHYSLAQSLKYSARATNAVGATSDDNYTAKLSGGYGAGVEGGLQLQHLTFSLEFGYTMFRAKSWSDSVGIVLDNHLQDVTADFSGTYFKAMLGVKF